MPAFCAIDFGISNSAIALPAGEGVRLVELEPGQRTMPTAVFYAVEGLAAHEAPLRHYGRAAVAAYVERIDGRLMRSMKSILGSTLASQSTEVGAGRSVRYLDVVGGYLRHLKRVAEAEAGHELTRLVLGRPVYFAEAAKIAMAEGGDTTLDLGAIEAGLDVALQSHQAVHALHADLQRIVATADETPRQAGVARQRVDAVYFTGGSPGLAPLAQRIAARFPAATVVRGDRFASVAPGLGVHALRVFGAARAT